MASGARGQKGPEGLWRKSHLKTEVLQGVFGERQVAAQTPEQRSGREWPRRKRGYGGGEVRFSLRLRERVGRVVPGLGGGGRMGCPWDRGAGRGSRAASAVGRACLTKGQEPTPKPACRKRGVFSPLPFPSVPKHNFEKMLPCGLSYALGSWGR